VTIARRRSTTLSALVAPPAPAVEVAPPPPIPVVLPPAPRDVPALETVTPAGRLRRCTFRRIDVVAPLPGRARQLSYEVMCLYGGDAATALALGDIDSARPICEACQATGIFRPDEA
jgi:hypothetical protein